MNICPSCNNEIIVDDDIKMCQQCGTYYHEKCWTENGGCTAHGCVEQYDTTQTNDDSSKETVCKNCGTILTKSQMFCPKCGTKKECVGKETCKCCGVELKKGEAYCTSCGQKVKNEDVAVVSNLETQFSRDSNIKRENKMIIFGTVVIATIAVIGIFILIFGSDKRPNFQKLYEEYCRPIWASVGNDGSYLSIDTNPFDADDDGMAYPDAYFAIKQVTEELGFSNSIYAEMGETTALMGKQSASTDNCEATWSYHPDRGLEVMFKAKK